MYEKVCFSMSHRDARYRFQEISPLSNRPYITTKKHKMALISEYLAADLSADASADALCIINIGEVEITLGRSIASKNYKQLAMSV